MKNLYRLLFAMLFVAPLSLSAQKEIVIETSDLSIEVGDQKQLSAYITEDGEKIEGEVIFRSRDRKILYVDSLGIAHAFLPGKASIIAFAAGVRNTFEMMVNFPPIAEIKIDAIPERIYAGTPVKIKYQVIDKAGLVREGAQVEMKSNNESIATIDAFGNIRTEKTGKATITASIEGIENTININVVKNPIVKIVLEAEGDEARTGDVFHFKASALNAKGNEISDAPIFYSFHGVADDVSQSAAGLIRQDGNFVADKAGIYTITASTGVASAQKTVKINPRNIARKIKQVGHGSVNDKHTSDFWVWEGADGRDYAVTGTWGADGTAYFWDVTDPASIIKIDSIQVDARTVNDVKVSEDGNITVISREGASDRKNGLVILDTSNPRDVKILSRFDENMTGGVHNVFIDKGYIYALSGGQKYYVINIKDPKNPFAVGKFELDTPGHAIHDVWVEDGIAYSSNWGDGLQLVDVGNGIAGGSPENPVQFASYTYPSGANHAAYPFRSKSTGKFYVIGGDEIFPYGLNMNGPNMAGGFLHFIDFSDLDNPKEVARYELPNAGSHNYWIEGETLYVAFYNGGVRIIDISGDLMGDLYAQGREIAFIRPSDPNGYIPNSPFTWGAQLHKGHVFYSDWNSGLWSAKVEPPKPQNVKIESK